MPDDNPSGSIEQRPVQKNPSTEPIDPPALPNNPRSENAKAIPEQNMATEIHGLEDRISGAERWMIWLTGGIVFLTAGIVIVGILQWNAMRGQLKEMQSGSADTHALAQAAIVQSQGIETMATAAGAQAIAAMGQVDAARVAADAAKSAAETASSALKESQRAFVIEQRPYIVTKVPVFNQQTIVAGRQISANVTIDNIGKTPARNIVTHLKFATFRPTDRPALAKFIDGLYADLRKKDADDRRTMQNVIDGKDLAPAATQFSTSESLTLPPDDVRLLLIGEGTDAGKIVLFYTGITSYTDASALYTTEFCYFFFGSTLATWHICDSHNTIK